MCCAFRNCVLWSIVISVFLAGVSVADSVSVETAQKAALQQINKVKASKLRALAESEDGDAEKALNVIEFLTENNVTEIISECQDGQVVYYVVTLKPEGWVIVSADDVAQPIIAYSATGFYSALPDDQPPAFKAWMANVKADISNAITKNLEPLPEAKAAWEQIEADGISGASVNNTKSPAASVAPLIRTKWGQGFPYHLPLTYNYNDYCPYEWIGPVQTFAVTGCMATAMAQIMKYYEWPKVGQGRHTYTTPWLCTWGNWGCTYGEQTANFGETYYNWNDMPLNSPSSSVALLMYHCGVATEMDYAWNGSQTVLVDMINPDDYNRRGARRALLRHFRYDTVWYLRGSTGPGAWEILLKENLDAGKPILYSGETPPGGSGHAFICDGYDNTGKFHFNWGWDGSEDGYYEIEDLTPGSSNYTFRQQGLFDIDPRTNSVVWVDDDFITWPIGTEFTVDYNGVSLTFTYGINAFRTVGEGIEQVDDGGTVIISGGHYPDNIEIDKSITLQHSFNEQEWDKPIIKGRVGPKPTIKVTAPGASIVLDGLILREGVGAYFDGSRKGGGLCVVDANDVIIKNCVFRRNDVPDTAIGGGMYAQNTVVHIRDCSFELNTATHGSGMSLVNSTGAVTNCLFELNDSDSYGGGIYLKGSVTPLITGCVFKGNNANFGGGIFCEQNTVADVRNCQFVNNSAYHRGGGMYNWTGANVVVTNCTFYGNEVTYEPPKEGGGIANSGCSPVITNCILWGNTPNQMHSTGGNPVVTYCDIGQSGFGGPDGSSDVNGNINKDPMFVSAGGGDFHLLEGSPAIDAGSNDAVEVGMEADMDGNRRIRHGDCDGTEDVDMGVFEFIHDVPGDCTGDCDINMLDFARLSGRWHTAGCGWCDGVDMTGDGIIDMADLRVMTDNWLQMH